jgi:hypothetical protein
MLVIYAGQGLSSRSVTKHTFATRTRSVRLSRARLHARPACEASSGLGGRPAILSSVDDETKEKSRNYRRTVRRLYLVYSFLYGRDAAEACRDGPPGVALKVQLQTKPK